MKCCLCKKEIKSKYGNNALPLKDGRCCDNCNSTKVIPARLKKVKMSLTEKIKCPICGKVEEGQFTYPLNDKRCTECRNKNKEVKK